MPSQPSARRSPTCCRRRAYLFSLAFPLAIASGGLGSDAAHAESARQYEVQALINASTTTLRTYRVTVPELADRLNVLVAPLAYANEACDYLEYVRLYNPVRTALGGTTAELKADKDTVFQIFSSLPSPVTLHEQWAGTFCNTLLAGKRELDPPPKHVLRVFVPCPVVLRADESAILWCERRAPFYSEAMKNAAQAALERVRGQFISCAERDNLKRALYELGRVYEGVVARNYDARVLHVDGLVDEYDLRRQQRKGQANNFVLADNRTVSSLRSDFSEARNMRWCSPARRRATR